MKKLLSLLVIVLFVFFSGCSKDDDSKDPSNPNNPNPPDIPVGSATIGSEGGTLSTDNLELIIPPGAFDANVDLELVKIQNNESGLINIVSDGYRLIGLPETISKPLSIKIKYTDPLSDSSFIAMGESLWASSLNDQIECYQLWQAHDSSGFLVATIPEAVGGKKSSDEITATHDVSFWAISGYYYYTSEQGHFKILFPSSVINEAYDLADYLETTYSKFLTMDFSYAARTKWPVKVTVKQMKSTVYGYSYNSVWGDNYGFMEFNFDKMGDSDDMKITAGHEFFHLVQSLYDSRNRFSKAKFRGDDYWFAEACSVWSEELFSDEPNYMANIFFDNAERPLSGAKQVNGSNSEIEGYGYGMASFVKFIDQKYGNKELVKVFDEMKTGKTPFEALSSALPSSVEFLWNEYIKRFCSFSIYNKDNFAPGWLITQALSNNGAFDITSASDTIKTFSRTYTDLSARIFYVKNQFSNLKDDAKLIFDAPGTSDNQILLFKVKNTESVYLKQGHNSVTLDNFKALTDAGYFIVAVITDNKSVAPYTTEVQVDLTIHVVSQQVVTYSFPFFEMSFPVLLKRTVSNSPDPDTLDTYLSVYLSEFIDFQVTGPNKLFVIFDYVSGVSHRIDTLEITLDNLANPTTILHFYYSKTTLVDDSGFNSEEKFKISGINIPLSVADSDGSVKKFKLDGNIYANILSIEYEESSIDAVTNYSQSLALIEADFSNTSIEIGYWVEEN